MLLPDGTYKMTVTESEVDVAKFTNKSFIKVILTASHDGLLEGVRVAHHFVISHDNYFAMIWFNDAMTAFGIDPGRLTLREIAEQLIDRTAMVRIGTTEYCGVLRNEVKGISARSPYTNVDGAGQEFFLDQNLKQYRLEGGVGHMTVNGTKARVWIKAANRSGHDTISRWIRLDLHTAREFHKAFDQALRQAEKELVLLNEFERTEGD